MTVITETHVDLNDPLVRRFLCSRDKVFSQPEDGELITVRGMESRGSMAFPAPATQVHAFTVLRRRYNIYTLTNTLIGSATSHSPVRHALDLALTGYLYVLRLLPEEKKLLIENAFRHYDPRVDPDVEKYAREFCVQNGIMENEFYVNARYTLTKTAAGEINDDQDRRLRDLYQGKEEYRLVQIGEDCLFEVPNELGRNDNVITVPDADDAYEQISEELDRDAEQSHCRQLEKMVERVVQVGWYPEFKTETECSWKQVLCWKQRVCVSVPYTRDANIVLYATLMYRGADRAFEKIFKHCLLEAAVAATVIGIILENLPAAIAAFRVLFVECVTRHTTQLMECLLPDLYLATERSGWRRVW